MSTNCQVKSRSTWPGSRQQHRCNGIHLAAHATHLHTNRVHLHPASNLSRHIPGIRVVLGIACVLAFSTTLATFSSCKCNLCPSTFLKIEANSQIYPWKVKL